jgi:hypothetical protein
MLSDRYIQASAMCLSANQYYGNLVHGITASDLAEWENNIKYAEEKRKDDITVMDIIGTTADRSAHDSGSADRQSPSGVGAEWMDLAIGIEEQQYVST